MICNYSQLDMYLFNGIGIGFDNFKKMRYRGLMRAEARCRMTTSQDWLLGRFTPDHSAHSTSTFTLLLHIFSLHCSPVVPLLQRVLQVGQLLQEARVRADVAVLADQLQGLQTQDYLHHTSNCLVQFGIKGGKKCRFEIRTLVAFILCFMTR